MHVVFSLDFGGMENGIVNVASLLDPAEFEIFVCCLERRGGFAERLPNPENVFVLGKRPGFSIRTVGQLMGLVQRLKIDVLHSHNLGPMIYGGLATGWGRWRPLLQGEHGQLSAENLTPRRMRLRRLFYSACARVQTVSHGLRQHLINHGFSGKKMVAIVNGVDTQRFAPASRASARQALGLSPAGPILGIVGRLCVKKRHLELIDAFGRFRRQAPAAQLLIVGGDGPDREKICQYARQHEAAAGICLAGFQSNPAPYYQAMDLLVAPSLIEGLSNVVLEAMACGVPVLAHDACGNSEVIQTGVDGFVEPIDGVEALYRSISNIFDCPEQLLEIGQRARQTAVDRFSLATMVDGYAQIYREIARSREGAM